MTRTFRNAAAAGALFAFALLASGVAGAGPVPAPPAAQAFKIGALSAWSLHDAQFTAPNDGKTFGVGQTPEMVSDVLRHGGAPSDMITLSVNVLLVKSPGHVMLFDTGLGAKLGGGLLKSLALTGTHPEDVTDIFITHSHGDHIGGLAADGRAGLSQCDDPHVREGVGLHASPGRDRGGCRRAQGRHLHAGRGGCSLA